MDTYSWIQNLNKFNLLIENVIRIGHIESNRGRGAEKYKGFCKCIARKGMGC